MKDGYKTKILLFLLIISLLILVNFVISEVIVPNSVIAANSDKLIPHGSELGFKDNSDLSTTDTTIEKKDNSVTFNKEGSLQYNHNGEIRSYENIDKGGKFIFKDKKLVEATFIATKDSTYTFGNHNVSVSKGSKIEFKDGNLKVILPKNSEVKKPVRIHAEKDDKDVIFEFSQTDKTGTFTIDGKKFSSPEGMKDGESFSVKFDNKLNEFYTDGKLVVDNIELGSRLAKKMFILSKVPSGEFQGSYIALEENKLSLYSQKGEVTSSVRLLSGNKYVNIPSNGELFIQARGLSGNTQLDKSLITIEPRKDQIPLIKTQGGFTIISGNKMFMYDSDMKSLRADPITSDNFKDKKSPIIQISSSMSNGEPIKYSVNIKDDKGNPKTLDVNVDFDLITSEDTSVISVKRGSDTDALSRLNINSFTALEKQKLLGLSNEKRTQVLSSSNPKDELLKLTQPPKPPQIKVEPDNNNNNNNNLPKIYQGIFRNDAQTSNGDPGLKDGINIWNGNNLATPNSVVRVKFGAEWCGPCKELDSQIPGMAKSNQRIGYITIDVEKQPELAKQFGYKGGSIPQTTTFIGGVNQNKKWN